jgi:hypothetical protein
MCTPRATRGRRSTRIFPQGGLKNILKILEDETQITDSQQQRCFTRTGKCQ